MKKIVLTSLILLLHLGVFSQGTINLNAAKEIEQVNRSNEQQTEFPPSINIWNFTLHSQIKNNSLSVGDKINFNIDQDDAKQAVVTYKKTDVNNVTSYICKFPDHAFSQAFISVNPEEYLISIDFPEEGRKLITVVSNNRKNYFLVELDPNNLDMLSCGGDVHHSHNHDVSPIHLDGHENNEPAKKNLGLEEFSPIETLSSSCESLGPDDDADITVLIIYTQASLDFAGSVASMNNKIAQAVTRANNASINTNLGMNFELVHSELTTYVESAEGSSTDLSRLRDTSDGHMDNVHSLRDTHVADFVHLISNVNDTGGIAYLLNNRYGTASNAFGLTRVQQLDWTDTFIHELGHNMSASHAAAQTTQPGPTSWVNWPGNNWTAGWRFLGNDGNYYCDLMTYGSPSFWLDGNGASSISYFSTPTISQQGQPIGNADQGDNARSLKEVKQAVAKYRDENTLLYCSASGFNPSSLNMAITNVSLNDLNSPSAWTGYSDFSYRKACLDKEETYPLVINVDGAHSGNQLLVWIDWNNDGDFEDTGELVFSSPVGFENEYTTNITPPSDAFTGEVRMRIRYQHTFSGGNDEPCGQSTFGEVEDYILVLSDSVECLFALVPENTGVSNISSSGADISWDDVPGAFYDLRFRETGETVWINIENINETSTTLVSLEEQTEYEVQVRSKCSGETPSDYSTSVLFTTLSCSTEIPVGLNAININSNGATITWDEILGLNYELRYRQDGLLDWIVVEDISEAEHQLIDLLPNTDYEVEVRSKCPSGIFSDFSSTLVFSTLPLTYCSSTGNDTSDEYISRVQFAAIDNSSADENGGYSDFTHINASIASGTSYEITITPTWVDQVYAEGYAVWIDFNQNGIFEEPEELVFSQSPTTNTPVTGMIEIPTSVSEGATRMRVSLKWNSIPGPCETFQYGEVEDYTINIYHGYVHENETWMPENPSGISVTGDNIRVIDGDVVLTGNTAANSLFISDGASLSTNHVLDISANIINTGDLIFLSNDENTGQLASFSGTISRPVEVQRYIPSKRTFRFLSTSVSGSTIADSWQEQIHITGAGGATNGFDNSASNAASMFTYDHSQEMQNQPWIAVASTSEVLEAGKPYRVLVRGDRELVDLSNNSSPSTEVTLSSKGTMHTGSFSVETSTYAENFSFVGNPYQSIVNLDELAYGDGVNRNFAYYWEPSLGDFGGFVTLTIPTVVPDPSSTNADHFLRPGQAVFMRNNDTGSNYSITFNESSKEPTGNQTQVFGSTNLDYMNLRVYKTEKYNANLSEEDAIGFRFSENYTNQISHNDAVKKGNAGLNFAAVKGNNLFSIQSRELPQNDEVIPLFINNIENGNYLFWVNLQETNLNSKVFLRDKYHDSMTEVSDGLNEIHFTIDLSIPESVHALRFELVFEDVSLSNSEFANQAYQLYPNPTSNGSFTIQSSAFENEELTVEIVNILGQKVFSIKQIASERGSLSINIENLQSATYILKINNQKGETITDKLIVK